MLALLGFATVLVFEGFPDATYYERRGEFARSVEVNPRQSSAWLSLGLSKESDGNLAGAETALLQAARVDRQYLPAWTLANFYFRRADWRSFWPWARRAASLSYGDLGALLKLCDLVEPGNVLEPLGESARIEHAYLDFLIRENRLDDAQCVALKMVAKGVASETPQLIDFTDRQIRAGHGEAALAIWNGLARARFIPFSPIDTSHILTNGKLAIAPTNEGFDWRLREAGPIAEWRASLVGFSFSETACDGCALMEQFLALGARTYRLRFEYRADVMPSPTGIRWALDSSESAVLPPNSSWSEAERVFSVSFSGLSRLRLIYRRDPGTTPAEGRLEIRNLRLEAL